MPYVPTVGDTYWCPKCNKLWEILQSHADVCDIMHPEGLCCHIGEGGLEEPTMELHYEAKVSYSDFRRHFHESTVKKRRPRHVPDSTSQPPLKGSRLFEMD